MTGKIDNIEGINAKRFMGMEIEGVEERKLLVSMINEKSDLMKGVYIYVCHMDVFICTYACICMFMFMFIIKCIYL
jgi:hypothetical protein